MRALNHIYCGDGKGKTSAAIGLSVRAAGRNRKVLIIRLIKTDDSGEITSLKYVPNIEVIPCDRTFGFTFCMDEATKIEARAYYTELLNQTLDKAVNDQVDLLVIDELMAAYNTNMIDRERIVEFIKNKPENLEIVLTGRDPASELLELADYVSDIHKVKHPFDQGIPAREAIEY